MDGSPNNGRLLFIYADPRDRTTQRGTRNKSLDSKIRRHLMRDIGMSRRKPPKQLPFVTLTWSLKEESGSPSSTCQGEHTVSQDPGHRQVHAKGLVTTENATQYTAPHIATPPILHALSVFEREWGEDSFSAYGLTLIMVAGRNATMSARSRNTFWVPFAFRKSAFLHHYQQIFASPNVMISLYYKSARELRSLALERSLETIQCVESRIASSDIGSATSDSVIHAVLATICYNFTTSDFDQALIHLKGISMVIEARGGISTLDTNQDLILMASWLDITAALLHDTRPIFSLPDPMGSACLTRDSGLEKLPTPLVNVINNGDKQNTRFMKILACIAQLNALAALLRLEQATKGNAIWDHEEHTGFLMNPVAHQLLSQPLIPELATQWDTVSEALRLGALIWIIGVKRRCRSYPGTAEAHVSTLLNMLSSTSDTGRIWNSPDLRIVRLWLLVLCTASDPNVEDLAISMEMIRSQTKEPSLVLWMEIMADVRQMPWLDIFERTTP